MRKDGPPPTVSKMLSCFETKTMVVTFLALALVMLMWNLPPYYQNLLSTTTTTTDRSSCSAAAATLSIANASASLSNSSAGPLAERKYSAPQSIPNSDKRVFQPVGNAAALFVLMGAYRGGPRTFAVVGLASKPIHVYGRPWYKCEWISNNGSSIRTVAYKMLPDWGYGRVYTVVVVNCTFPVNPNQDNAGGMLTVNAYYGESPKKYEKFTALEEAPGSYNESKYHPPYEYEYLYCGSSLYGNLSAARIREWMAYHAWFFGPKSQFSAMEIYNESVRDLLSADGTPLRLLDDPERGTIVEKLTEETLRDWNHFKELLSLCEAQRQIGETFLNEASSRSHQILRLTIESSAREFLGNDKSSSLTATVNFVDLAGSERASQSLAAGTRLKEGCHINRSLLTLGTVIRKLSKGRNGHVPFRDSKLTRILQSSLGGNARTAIICTMSPARSHVEQSRNTLLFASCAKEVSTNAQVNVVMSDKALVKHLQRELARLEGELRSSGPTSIISDSAALFKEKDLQIEKLKKEIKELTLQLDLAQSQVKDLLRLVGDDGPTIVLAEQDHHYPKMRVRASWDFENQISATPILADPQCLDDVGVRSFDASQYSDGHSRSSSDDNLFQLPNFKHNFSPTHSSPRLSVTIPNFVGNDEYQEETEEQTDEKSEDLCREVRCIEIEEPRRNRYLESNMSDSSPNRYTNKNIFCSSPNGYANSNISSPVSNIANSEVTLVKNGDKANQVLVSPQLKEDKELNSFITNFVEKPSPWAMEYDIPSSGSVRLTRSRSCKASLMTSLSPPLFEKEEKHKSTPPIVFEKEFTGRPEGLQMKLSTLKYEAIMDRLSRSISHTSAETATIDELKVQDAKSSIDEDGTSRCTLTAGIDEMADLHCENQHADHVVPEIEPKSIASTKSVKDVGLDPLQDDTGSPSKWPSEFKRLQGEIIELWHACNISLVHRTYFFLLFKGDPTDSIYMEVELRRLSFLQEIFSRGSQTVEDGQTLTPTSSMKALRRERQMLSRQMQKRLSKQDRQNLFLKWGIGLNTKHRRLQLVHCLWTDTRDMDHIAASAGVVSKLVGSVEPGHAFKEMFGLNFTPRRSSRRSLLWKPNMKYLL